jgi:hypothetical protein
MVRIRTGILFLMVISALFGANVSAAGATTTIGQTFVPTDGYFTAGTVVPSVTPGTSYAVPADGVITSWNFQASSFATPQMKLKIVRPAGVGTYTTVGDSQLQTPVPNTLNVFTTRIPVKAGDVLGNYYSGGDTYGLRAMAGYKFVYTTPPNPDPTPGTTTAYLTDGGDGYQIDLAATLEPDVDGDGYGDETQDLCPTDPITADQCPPQTTITKTPKKKATQKQARFEFGSDQQVATFECSLDGGGFAVCNSPRILSVGKGQHNFQVRALNSGLTDATPAAYDWRVVKKKHKPHSHH